MTTFHNQINIVRSYSQKKLSKEKITVNLPYSAIHPPFNPIRHFLDTSKLHVLLTIHGNCEESICD